jgi:hypothetical protein
VILVVDTELSFSFYFPNISYILGQYNNLIHVNTCISIAAAEALTVVIQAMKTMVVTFFRTSLQVFGH